MQDSDELADKLDRRAQRRAFDNAAKTFDDAAALHAEVRHRLLTRLKVIRGTPKTILDLGAATGHGSRELKKQFGAAQIIALDWSLPMLQKARSQIRWLRSFDRVCADATALPFRSQSIDWCISNLLPAASYPPHVVFAEVQRVLRPSGLFMFTSLGPDSLKELRAANVSADRHPRVHRFIDMHDLGDALARTGFAEPVMDVERIVLTYRSATHMLRELKQSGSTNALLSRPRHLGQRGALSALISNYEAHDENGRVSATFEIVYGHAWCGERRSMRQHETRISPESLRGRRRLDK